MFEKLRKYKREKEKHAQMKHLLGDGRQIERNMRVNGIKPQLPDYRKKK